MSRDGWWRPYVPVAQRRENARRRVAKLKKQGMDIRPVEIEGRKIARTFWGAAWCDHIESFGDYENRLPRGRTYARNGSICHLDIREGEIRAMVSGSEIYSVEIAVEPLPPHRWEAVRKRCAGRIGSLLELLEGRFSENVMAVVADRETGLFPRSGEIDFECSCPDWAVMCKHVAAVFYGVGARLDEEPELLFRLRGVDPEALIGVEADLTAAEARGGRRRIAEDALGDVFGIEVNPEAEASSGFEPASGAAPAKSAKTAKPSGATGKTAKGAKSSKAAGKTAKGGKPSKATGKKSVPAKPSKVVVRQTAAGKPSKIGKKPTSPPAGKGKDRSAAPDLPPTGEAMARLRADFDMTQAEFAKLLGVSVGSVCNWEKKRGPLDLQARSRAAWDAASRLTKKQAWRELDWE